MIAAVSGRVPLVPSVPCTASWLVRNRLGIVGTSDDYVLPRWEPGSASGDGGGSGNSGGSGNGHGDGHGGSHGNGNGGYRCHLAMGGARCAWPNVVPAWLQSVRAIYDDASPELVRAPRLSARLRASDGVPWSSPEETNRPGKRQCRKRNGCADTPVRAGKGEGGGDNPPCNASVVGLRLAFDVAALRTAAAAVANEVRRPV